jgi:hypothetical protein
VKEAATFEFAAATQRISVHEPRTRDKWRVKSSLTAGGFEIDGRLRIFFASAEVLCAPSTEQETARNPLNDDK